MIRASHHQGNLKYRGNGRQCMANAIQAVLHATEVAPKNWLSNTLDSILEDGDDIYTNVLETSKTQLTFLTLDDIPSSLAVISNTCCGPGHGESEGPFINLNNALVKLTSNASRVGLSVTMGKGSPGYSSANLKSDDMFYFLTLIVEMSVVCKKLMEQQF